MNMKPSDFLGFPWESIAGNIESEIVAHNIMVVLARNGNTFRRAEFSEYFKEREKDGNYSSAEESIFIAIREHCESEAAAREFSRSWGQS